MLPGNNELLGEFKVVEWEMLPPASKSAIKRLLADSTEPNENKYTSNIFAQIFPQLYIKYKSSIAKDILFTLARPPQLLVVVVVESGEDGRRTTQRHHNGCNIENRHNLKSKWWNITRLARQPLHCLNQTHC